MRLFVAAIVLAGAALLTGCGATKPTNVLDGPTVDKFGGQLLHNGKAVTFTESETVQLKLIFQAKPESFGIPIKADGTFDIGKMPIRAYSATLIRTRAEGGKKSAPQMHNVPNGLTIQEGQTEYKVELGPDFKP